MKKPQKTLDDEDTFAADVSDAAPALVTAPTGHAELADTEIGRLPQRDPLRRFLAEAGRYPRLSEDEEKDLIRAVRDKDDRWAARRLVLHNLRLVVSIAYQYRQAWLNMLDLFGEGSVGLMEAVKRWDPSVGTRFGSYASYWIRAYILRFLMTNARLIHVGNTRAGRKLFFRLEKERQKLLAEGFDATPKLLAAKLDVSEKDVIEVSSHMASREVPMDATPGDEGISLEERISTGAISPEEEASQAELSTRVRALMRQFETTLTDKRERAIWREHLATDGDPRPLSALGERFGQTKQRMSQLAEGLKKRFREIIISELGTDIKMSWLGSRRP